MSLFVAFLLAARQYIFTERRAVPKKKESEPVTDEMVERAVVAHETARRNAGWFTMGATLPKEDREWMRAALEAAING